MKKSPASKASKWMTVGSFCLLLSVGLHGLALVIPMPSSDPPLEEKPVKVVSLAKASPVPSTQIRQPKPIKTPAKAKPPQKPTIATKPAPANPTPSPSAAPTPAKPSPPPPQSAAKPLDPPAKPDTPQKPGEVLEGFSQELGAQPSCDDSETCWQIEETQWRSVAGNLTEHLEKRGYTVAKLDDREDEEGMGIYQVDTRDGKTKYYLHLLLTDQGTVYLLDPKQLTREQLEQRIEKGA